MKTIWSPCCEEFLHRTCIQGHAYSAGSYVFRYLVNFIQICIQIFKVKKGKIDGFGAEIVNERK